MRFAVVDALFVVDPEPEADVVARRVYETTLSQLREKSVVTQTQEARARQEAGGDVRRVGEKLLLGGVLSVAAFVGRDFQQSLQHIQSPPIVAR